MRTILGYIDGRAVWSDNTPAQPLPSRYATGSLAVSSPSPVKGQRLTASQAKTKERVRAIRAARKAA